MDLIVLISCPRNGLRLITLLACFLFSFAFKHQRSDRYIISKFILRAVSTAPFDDIIPFLSEHIQPSDQLLFAGATTDMSIQLSKAGYGTKKTGDFCIICHSRSGTEALLFVQALLL